MRVAKTSSNEAEGNVQRLIVGLGIVVCLIVVVVMLYPAAQSYYVAYRMNEQLLQELVAVEARNDQIREQIAYLNTKEGIADRARERFGWVQNGEQAVNITGLDISDSTTVLPENVAAGSVKAPENRWTQFLDVLFAVEEEQAAEPIPDPFLSDTGSG